MLGLQFLNINSRDLIIVRVHSVFAQGFQIKSSCNLKFRPFPLAIGPQIIAMDCCDNNSMFYQKILK